MFRVEKEKPKGKAVEGHVHAVGSIAVKLANGRLRDWICVVGPFFFRRKLSLVLALRRAPRIFKRNTVLLYPPFFFNGWMECYWVCRID